jgi:hypothetical protein
MAAGRPSEYDFELCLDILEEIANGNNIIAVLDSNDKYPSWSTFRRWKRDNAELQTLYVNAQQDKTESLIHNIQKVQKMCLDGEIEPSVANTVMQTDKWLSSKFYPKMYGDIKQIDLNVDDKRMTPEERNKKIEELKAKLIAK